MKDEKTIETLMSEGHVTAIWYCNNCGVMCLLSCIHNGERDNEWYKPTECPLKIYESDWQE